MARPGVTYNDVAKACEQIKADGGKPSINGVRNLLGTGSPNNLSAHIRAWRESTTQTEGAAAIELPKAVIVSITNEIERSVNEAKEKLQEEVAALQKELAQVITHCDKLDVELQEARTQISDSNDEFQASKAIITEKETVIEQLESSLKNSQAQVEEHRANAEISRVELAKVLIKQEVLSKQVEGLADLQSKCSQSEKESEVAQAKEAAAHDTIKRLEDMIQELKLKNNNLESSRIENNGQSKELQSKLSECEKQHAVLEERLIKISKPEKEDKKSGSKE